MTVRVLSARQLPKKRAEGSEKSVIDPYVEVQILGNPKDEALERTKVVPGNGYSPSWDETFRFRFMSSSTAFVLITVLDSPNARRIGWYALPVEALRSGYHNVPLLDDACRELPTGSLFCHFKLGNPSLASDKDK